MIPENHEMLHASSHVVDVGTEIKEYVDSPR